MRLTAFQSGKGDCLLLSNDKARILVDGGMPAAYRDHVANTLSVLRTQKKPIDLAYISHIDQDHIGGILQMLDHEVAWRVHDFQKANGNGTHKAPVAPRPAEIRKIWHNAFNEQITENAADIEDALAAAAPILAGAQLAKMRAIGAAQSELATSINEAIRVSRRVSPGQLKIPLNPEADGKLMMFRKKQPPVNVGGMVVTILGPTRAHLIKLRKDWNTWLSKNQSTVKALRAQAKKDEERIGASEVDRLMMSLALQAEMFGDPDSVTPPNLASLTLLVEEKGQSVLLTGDARGDQIVDGLRATGRLAAGRTFHVNVLKVPHHGSENNIDSDFCDTVIATDYVFCGNGEHENPDLRVVKMMAQRRLAADPAPFKFWFNSSDKVSVRKEAAAHMAEVENLVTQLASSSKARMKFKFLASGSSMSIV